MTRHYVREQAHEAAHRIGQAQKNGAIELDLNNLGLTVVPLEIGQLTALQGLNLGNNQLTVVPPEIMQLTKLQSLNLDGNWLTGIPPEFVQLTVLRELDLGNNEGSVANNRSDFSVAG